MMNMGGVGTWLRRSVAMVIFFAVCIVIGCSSHAPIEGEDRLGTLTQGVTTCPAVIFDDTQTPPHGMSFSYNGALVDFDIPTAIPVLSGDPTGSVTDLRYTKTGSSGLVGGECHYIPALNKTSYRLVACAPIVAIPLPTWDWAQGGSSVTANTITLKVTFALLINITSSGPMHLHLELGSTPILLSSNVCVQNLCDMVHGGTMHPPVPDGTPCTTGSQCTTDSCQAGSCTVGPTIPRCDSSPTTGDQPFETRASLLGRVVTPSGTPVPNYTVQVFNAPANGTPRSDLELTTGNDGSFRGRLTTLPDVEAPGTPPTHLLLYIDSPNTLRVVRDAYVHAGDAVDFGTIVAPTRDSATTMIGPEGGTAHDSQNLMEVVIPAGALSTTIPVRITPIQRREEMPAQLPDATLTMYGFELEPDGTQFAVPVTVRMTNYRNVPTTATIPVGWYNRAQGRWEDINTSAVWDGSKFAFAATHFSIFDCNNSTLGTLVFHITRGSNPNKATPTCGVGSGAGFANGSLTQQFGLPTYERLGERFGVSLHYDSGLAGSRSIGAATAPPTAYNATSPTSVAVSMSGGRIQAECVMPRPGGAEGTAPGTCSSGTPCRLGTTSVAFPIQVNWSGGASTQTESVTPPPNTGSIEFGSYIQLPNGASPPATGFMRTTMTTLIQTSSACLDAAVSNEQVRTFGTSNTALPGTQTSGVAQSPVTIETRQLLHHRHNSPFGAGWAVSNVHRLFRDSPTGDRADLVWGTGQEETFRPRAIIQQISNFNSSAQRLVARDETTGEIYFLKTTDAEISKFDPATGTATPVVGGGTLSVGTPHGLAVTHVGGGLEFIVASSAGIFEVPVSGSMRQLSSGNWSSDRYSTAHVVARNDLVFFTLGAYDAQHFAVLNRVRLTDPNREVSEISARPGHDARFEPDGTPLSGVSFAGPSGLAFAPDGSLYMADRNRNVVYRILMDANGEVGPTSLVKHAVGDGMGLYIPQVGDRFAGRVFSLNGPLLLSTSPEGTLFVANSYGVAKYDPAANEAEWYIFDNNISGSDLYWGFLNSGVGSLIGMSTNQMLANVNGDFVTLTINGLTSIDDPTRTVSFDPTGAAVLTDTSAESTEIYDPKGRMTERRLRTGEPRLAVTYADSISDRISTIRDATGGQTTFNYTNGKIANIVDPTGRTTQMVIDSWGDLAGFTEPDGEIHSFTYQGHHMLSKTSSRGDVTRYTYADDGTLKTSTRPGGEVTTLTSPAYAAPQQFDSSGRAFRVGSYTDMHGIAHTIQVNPKGIVEQDTYTADGIPYVEQTAYASLLDVNESYATTRVNNLYRVKYTTVNGLIPELETLYDGMGRVGGISMQPYHSGYQESYFAYDANGRISRISHAGSNAVRMFERDSVGRLSSIYEQSNVTLRKRDFTWRTDGQPSTVVDHGVTYTFGYDATTSNLTSVSDTLGRTSSFTYDANGNLQSSNNGATTTNFTFDTNNRLVQASDASGNTTTYGYTHTACGCTESDLLTSIHTPDLPSNKRWQMQYGVEGRLTAIVDPDGRSESYGYEVTGEQNTFVDRLLRASSATHDSFGRAVSSIDALGRTHVQSYAKPSSGGWAGGTIFAGSASGAPPSTALTSALNNGDYQIGISSYDSYGTNRSRGLPIVSVYRDATFELGYDERYESWGGRRPIYERDRAGLSISSTTDLNGAGQYVDLQSVYNVDTVLPIIKNQVSNYSGYYESTTFSQSNDFDLTSAGGWGNNSPWVSIGYLRDVAGRPVGTSRTFQSGYYNPGVPPGAYMTGLDSTYAYKSTGQLDTAVTPDGSYSYAYDARGLVQAITVAGEGSYVFAYDAVGRNTSLQYPDGHVRVQSYDAEGHLLSRCYNYTGAASRCYTATYDAVGNPTQMTERDGNGTVFATDVLTYDNLNRLTRLTRSVTGQSPVVEDYSYNTLGALKGYAGLTLDDQRPRISGAGMSDAAIPNSFGGAPVTMDPAGRVTSLKGVSVTYNKRGRVVAISRPSGAGTETERYGMDAFQRRTSRIRSVSAGTNTTKELEEYYAYEGSNLVAVLGPPAQGSTTPIVRESWLFEGVDLPLRLNIRGPPSETFYYELDTVGNVRRLRRPDGSDAGGYRYSAFGQLSGNDAVTPAPAISQSLQWKARWHDTDFLDLYDVRARQWSPELGAFLSIDGFAFHDPTSTLWGWPNQNPIRYRDPSGHCAACIGAEVGFFGGALSYVATAPMSSMSFGGMLDAGMVGAIAGGAAGLNPYAGIFAIGALGVESENDLWKFVLVVPALGNTAGRAAPATAGAECPLEGAAGNAAEGAAPKIASGSQVTEQVIRDAMKGAPLKSQQAGGVSLPRVQQYVDKLFAGEAAPAIKVDGQMIVDGNHRYVAGRILGQEPPIQPWGGGRPGNAVPWEALPVDPAAW